MCPRQIAVRCFRVWRTAERTGHCIVPLFLLAVIYIYLCSMPCYAILSRGVIFNDIVIELLLVCIRYCAITEHCGLWTLQSLTFLYFLACFVWIWLSLYCNFGYFVCRLRVVVDYSLKFWRGTGHTTGQNADVLLYDRGVAVRSYKGGESVFCH